jgi:hypothetical protein
VAAKRKLPVLKDPPGAEDEIAERSPWQWVAFGIVLIFAAWLPLAWLAETVKGRLVARVLGSVASAEDAARAMESVSGGGRATLFVATIVLPAIAMVLGAAAGGYVIARWGTKTTAREAALAGLAAAGVAAVLSWLTAGFSLAPLVAAPILGVGAYLGGRRGVRAKR